MALQLNTLTTEYGIEINDVYVRVESVSLPNKKSLVFTTCFYAKQNFPPISSQQYSCLHVPDGDGVIKQAYLYLKTLPEFANSIDC
jgi:hypothetical protein